MATRKASWVPDRGEIIWIDFNPKVGREMRDMHPMLVLSPKAFNDRTSLVIGLPTTTATYNDSNLRLPLKTGVHSPLIKRQFCAAPPTSVARTASD